MLYQFISLVGIFFHFVRFVIYYAAPRRSSMAVSHIDVSVHRDCSFIAKHVLIINDTYLALNV